MEYVIPGTEQVVKPRRRAFKADGDQHVIPGAEQILDKKYLRGSPKNRCLRDAARSVFAGRRCLGLGRKGPHRG